MNRGRLRGWVFVGAVVLVFLALLAWPDLLFVFVFVALAAGLAVLGVWIHRTLPDVERAGEEDPQTSEPKDVTTGGHD